MGIDERSVEVLERIIAGMVEVEVRKGERFLQDHVDFLLLWLGSGSGAAKPGAGATYPHYPPHYSRSLVQSKIGMHCNCIAFASGLVVHLHLLIPLFIPSPSSGGRSLFTYALGPLEGFEDDRMGPAARFEG